MAHILVIDDESNVRMMLRLALVHVGHTLETASDGYEGLERFGNGTGWDLVLLDQRMPGLEGLEVLREIRQRAPEARVIMITAFGTINLATEAIEAGATDFLRKPFTVETLRGAVAAALAGVPATPDDTSTPLPYSFERNTVNGFRIYSAPGVSVQNSGGIDDRFTIRAANGAEQACQVSLPPYVVELVRAHADTEEIPGGDRFWQALCGEALANYLWQNAAPPEDGSLVVDDLTSGLRHWIDVVLSATAK